MDRNFLDFDRLRHNHAAGAFFVIRARCNMRSYVGQSRPVDSETGLRCDRTIRLNSIKGRQN